jgi:hypothetical protein
MPFQAESTKYEMKRRGVGGRGDNNEAGTLTDPPTIPKDRRTRIWLGAISQVPFRIEFQRIGVSIWVVQELPIYRVRSPGTDRKENFDEEVSPLFLSLTRCLRSPNFPWE